MGAEQIPQIPHHVAIIPDGNRRWAKERGLPTFEGHRRGFENIFGILKEARRLGIQALTVWAFSADNFKRSESEVAYLMKLYEEMIDRHLPEALKNETRIIHAGRKDRIPPSLAKKIQHAEEQTSHLDRHYFVIALDYSGDDELERATQKWQAAQEGDTFTVKALYPYLDTSALPQQEIDLIIRTSGEQRLSGFFMIQTARSELEFVPEHFPSFSAKQFKQRIEEFSSRDRRFGE